MDIHVKRTQEWLNATYGNDARYERTDEDGMTGQGTIDSLILALQIELGLESTAPNFGPGTVRAFLSRYPSGITEQLEVEMIDSRILKKAMLFLLVEVAIVTLFAEDSWKFTSGSFGKFALINWSSGVVMLIAFFAIVRSRNLVGKQALALCLGGGLFVMFSDYVVIGVYQMNHANHTEDYIYLIIVYHAIQYELVYIARVFWHLLWRRQRYKECVSAYKGGIISYEELCAKYEEYYA